MDSRLIEGVLHDIFNLYFFLGYDKQANWFLIRFHQDIQTKKTIKSCLRGVHDAAESKFLDFVSPHFLFF